MAEASAASILARVLLRIGCAPDVPLRRLQTFLGLLYHCVDFEVEVIHLPTGEQLRRGRRVRRRRR